MIKNEKEFAVAKAELRSFDEAFDDFDVVEEMESGVDPIIAKAQRDSYAQKILDLKQEIETYEKLVSGQTTKLPVNSIESLGEALIAARLSKGFNQRQLAEFAGLKEQQIQRYEKDLYASANIRRLSLIANALDVSFDGIITSSKPKVTKLGSVKGLAVSLFPFSKMKTSGWFGEEVKNQARLSEEEKRVALTNFFDRCSESSGNALHRKTTSSVSDERRASLLAWQSQVLFRAQEISDKFPRFSPIRSEVINGLAKLSSDDDGIPKLIETLSSYGIIVIFEPHLPKTKIDGAALSLNNGKHAVIGMSVRYNRFDNFWFVILHELGHLVRHWDQVKSLGIIDEEIGADAMQLIEREADEFAENAILPMSVWKGSMVRFSKDSSQVIKFANRHEIHPALVAGRIRRERGYKEFPELVGEGEVKKILEKDGHWRAEK